MNKQEVLDDRYNEESDEIQAPDDGLAEYKKKKAEARAKKKH